MAVRLIQLLCPSRHCLVAAAYETEGDCPENVIRKMEEEMASLRMNRWCGICGSKEIRFEDAPTGFPTLAEALPALKHLEQLNLLARELMGGKF